MNEDRDTTEVATIHAIDGNTTTGITSSGTTIKSANTVKVTTNETKSLSSSTTHVYYSREFLRRKEPTAFKLGEEMLNIICRTSTIDPSAPHSITEALTDEPFTSDEQLTTGKVEEDEAVEAEVATDAESFQTCQSASSELQQQISLEHSVKAVKHPFALSGISVILDIQDYPDLLGPPVKRLALELAPVSTSSERISDLSRDSSATMKGYSSIKKFKCNPIRKPEMARCNSTFTEQKTLTDVHDDCAISDSEFDPNETQIKISPLDIADVLTVEGESLVENEEQSVKKKKSVKYKLFKGLSFGSFGPRHPSASVSVSFKPVVFPAGTAIYKAFDKQDAIEVVTSRENSNAASTPYIANSEKKDQFEMLEQQHHLQEEEHLKMLEKFLPSRHCNVAVENGPYPNGLMNHNSPGATSADYLVYLDVLEIFKKHRPEIQRHNYELGVKTEQFLVDFKAREPANPYFAFHGNTSEFTSLQQGDPILRSVPNYILVYYYTELRMKLVKEEMKNRLRIQCMKDIFGVDEDTTEDVIEKDPRSGTCCQPLDLVQSSSRGEQEALPPRCIKTLSTIKNKSLANGRCYNSAVGSIHDKLKEYAEYKDTVDTLDKFQFYDGQIMSENKFHHHEYGAKFFKQTRWEKTKKWFTPNKPFKVLCKQPDHSNSYQDDQHFGKYFLKLHSDGITQNAKEKEKVKFKFVRSMVQTKANFGAVFARTKDYACTENIGEKFSKKMVVNSPYILSIHQRQKYVNKLFPSLHPDTKVFKIDGYRDDDFPHVAAILFHGKKKWKHGSFQPQFYTPGMTSIEVNQVLEYLHTLGDDSRDFQFVNQREYLRPGLFRKIPKRIKKACLKSVKRKLGQFKEDFETAETPEVLSSYLESQERMIEKLDYLIHMIVKAHLIHFHETEEYRYWTPNVNTYGSSKINGAMYEYYMKSPVVDFGILLLNFCDVTPVSVSRGTVFSLDYSPDEGSLSYLEKLLKIVKDDCDGMSKHDLCFMSLLCSFLQSRYVSKYILRGLLFQVNNNLEFQLKIPGKQGKGSQLQSPTAERLFTELKKTPLLDTPPFETSDPLVHRNPVFAKFNKYCDLFTKPFQYKDPRKLMETSDKKINSIRKMYEITGEEDVRLLDSIGCLIRDASGEV